MNEIFTVVWTPTAENDFLEVITHIASDAPATARTLFNKIKRKAASLNRYPDRGRVLPELKDQGITVYREIIIPPWRLIYRTAEKEVIIHSFLDSRRNLEDILLRRLI